MPKAFTEYWTPPFDYDPEGSRIIDAKGEMVADVRGWGYLTGKGALGLSDERAEDIQDQLGGFIAEAMNMRWPDAEPRAPKG